MLIMVILGDLVSTTAGTNGLDIGGINAPGGSIGTPGISTGLPGISIPGVGLAGFSIAGVSIPGVSIPGVSTPGVNTESESESELPSIETSIGSIGGYRLKPNIVIPNPQVPEIRPTRPEFPKPPKQVTVQVPDKRKVVKNPGHKENPNFVPNFSNQYVPYQYQYPNVGNSKIPPYNAVFGVAPGIIPLGYYPIPPTGFDSMPTMLNKPSKKKTGDHQGTQNSKKPEKTGIPFISISVSPHQKMPNSNLQRDLTSTNIEDSVKSIYSQNQVQAANQAAYFNYLNTYSPNFNNENEFSSQNVRPIKHSNQLNPFTSPFSSNHFTNGMQQQSNSQMNLPNNVQNSFTNPNSPFSSFNPPPLGNLPPQFYANPSNSVSNSRPFEYFSNEDSEESGEESPFARRY